MLHNALSEVNAVPYPHVAKRRGPRPFVVRSADASPLIRLKDGIADRPLFMIHGLGGTFAELSRLAELIDIPDIVYGFRARGHDGLEEPLDDVDAIAAYYARAIRAVQPRGPYHLCGYSFGGVIAVEIARLLKDAGETVALLALVESYALRRTWPLRSRIAAQRCNITRRLAILLEQGWRERADYAGRKLSGIAGAIAARLRGTNRAVAAAPPTPLVRIHQAETRARANFTPRYYPGKIVFLRPAITFYSFPPSPAPIWGPLSEELEIVVVEGDHKTMISQRAGSVARILTDRIARG